MLALFFIVIQNIAENINNIMFRAQITILAEYFVQLLAGKESFLCHFRKSKFFYREFDGIVICTLFVRT